MRGTNGARKLERTPSDKTQTAAQKNFFMFFPFYEQIFGEKYAQTVRAGTLLNLIYSVVDGAMYDEFQSRVYAEKNLTAARVQEIFADVYEKYGYQEYDGFQQEWMDQIHNFEQPMYYISYAASALPALELFARQQADPGEAMDTYLRVASMDGCRIGFDAGGSDRKVSAVVDGKTVYSEEVVWQPKQHEDPQYHFDGIVSAFKTAASKMPRVDGIGVSSAGVFIGNSAMVSSLFMKVPRSRRGEVKTIYDRAAKELGNVPIVVANDGDVTALAGAMSMTREQALKIAVTCVTKLA